MRRKALDKSDRELLDELYRSSYRVVLSRTARKLGDYGRAEELLSRVYTALVPRLDKLRRLNLEVQVAYTVASAMSFWRVSSGKKRGTTPTPVLSLTI